MMTDSLSRFSAFLSLAAFAGHRRIQQDLQAAGTACATDSAQNAVWALADAHGLDSWASEQHYFAALGERNQDLLDSAWKAPMQEVYQIEKFWYYEVVRVLPMEKCEFYRSLKDIIGYREVYRR